MAKRKITVTVDEELVEVIQREGADNLSAVVNAALAEHAERLARRAALKELLDAWEAELGPVDDDALAWADAAFDELFGGPPAEGAA